MENFIDDDELEAYTYADIGLASPRHDGSSIGSDYTYLGEQHDVLLNVALSDRGRAEETALVVAAQKKLHMYPTRRKAVLPLEQRVTVLFKKEKSTTTTTTAKQEWEVNMIGQAVAVTCRDVVIKKLYDDGIKEVLLTFHLDTGKCRIFNFYLPVEWTTRLFVILLALSVEESGKSLIVCASRGEQPVYKDVNSILTNYGAMLTSDLMSLALESSYNSIIKGGCYCNTNF